MPRTHHLTGDRTWRQECANGREAALTVSTFVAFIAAFVSYVCVGDLIAKDLKCEGFSNVFFDDPSCPALKRIAILNGGAAWAEGVIITYNTIFAVLIGEMAGTVRYVLNKVASKKGRRIYPVIINTRTESSRLLEVELVQTDRTHQVRVMGGNALFFSKVMGLLGTLIGLRPMLSSGNEILDELGSSVTMQELFLFSRPLDDPEAMYLAMTSFAYPWAYGTWLGAISWQLAFIFQVLPQKIKPSFFSRAGVLANRKYVNYQAELLSISHLSIKIFGVLAAFFLYFPVVSDGVRFSNAVLNTFGCEHMSLLDLVFKNKFDENSPICSPLLQLLGIDSFPAVTEIYDMLPLALIVLVVSVVVGSLVWGVKVHELKKSSCDKEVWEKSLEKQLTVWHDAVDDIYNKGFYVCLGFIPISAYGIFFAALPKANQLLKVSPGCENFSFPSVVWEFPGSSCLPRNAYRAVAANVSTTYIIFMYSAMTLYVLGMMGYTAYLGVKKVPEGLQLLKRAPSFFAGKRAGMPESDNQTSSTLSADI